MNKQIYTVFTCDNWKSRDSMNLIFCSTSQRKLKSFIAKKIEDNTFSYNHGEEDLSKNKQVKMFKSDFDIISHDYINCNLNGGYLDYYYDGEEI